MPPVNDLETIVIDSDSDEEEEEPLKKKQKVKKEILIDSEESDCYDSDDAKEPIREPPMKPGYGTTFAGREK
eukprot:3932293-Rhodomonas_salina.1